MVTRLKMKSLNRTVCKALVSLFFLVLACSIHAEKNQTKLRALTNEKDGAEMILITGKKFPDGVDET